MINQIIEERKWDISDAVQAIAKVEGGPEWASLNWVVFDQQTQKFYTGLLRRWFEGDEPRRKEYKITVDVLPTDAFVDVAERVAGVVRAILKRDAAPTFPEDVQLLIERHGALHALQTETVRQLADRTNELARARQIATKLLELHRGFRVYNGLGFTAEFEKLVTDAEHLY